MTPDDLRPEVERIAALPEGQQLAALIACLATRHAARNALAGAVLARLGPPAVSILIGEALAPRRAATFRVRLLDVVEGIGVPLAPGDWFSLYAASPRLPRTVRNKLVRLLVRLKPVAQRPAEPRGLPNG